MRREIEYKTYKINRLNRLKSITLNTLVFTPLAALCIILSPSLSLAADNNISVPGTVSRVLSTNQSNQRFTGDTQERNTTGACDSTCNVLNGEIPAIAPDAIITSSQTQTVPCGVGFTGSKTQQRSLSGNTLGPWTDLDTSACVCGNTFEQRPQTCASPQSGSYTEQRDWTCATPSAGSWSSWSTVSSTCFTPCSPAGMQSNTLSCPGGAPGQIVQERVSSCPGGIGSNSSAVWSSWNTVSNTCAAQVCVKVVRSYEQINLASLSRGEDVIFNISIWGAGGGSGFSAEWALDNSFGGGGGGGGSSAIIKNGVPYIIAAGGNGGRGNSTLSTGYPRDVQNGFSGEARSTVLNIAASDTFLLDLYVGGGGGAPSSFAGGGGGAGYFGGGAGGFGYSSMYGGAYYDGFSWGGAGGTGGSTTGGSGQLTLMPATGFEPRTQPDYTSTFATRDGQSFNGSAGVGGGAYGIMNFGGGGGQGLNGGVAGGVGNRGAGGGGYGGGGGGIYWAAMGGFSPSTGYNSGAGAGGTAGDDGAGRFPSVGANSMVVDTTGSVVSGSPGQGGPAHLSPEDGASSGGNAGLIVITYTATSCVF